MLRSVELLSGQFNVALQEHFKFQLKYAVQQTSPLCSWRAIQTSREEKRREREEEENRNRRGEAAQIPSYVAGANTAWFKITLFSYSPVYVPALGYSMILI